MSTLLESRLFGFRVSLAAPGWYVCDHYRNCDSKAFPFATLAIAWGLSQP
jgi:hypothetical protein